MLEEAKKAAMTGAMKVLTHPAVTKLMSDPRVMNALSKGIEIHGQVKKHVEEKIRSLAETFNLISKK